MYDTNTGLAFLGIRIRQYYISCVQSFTPSRTDQLLYERLRQGFCLTITYFCPVSSVLRTAQPYSVMIRHSAVNFSFFYLDFFVTRTYIV
jgi:hypothetical protein